MSEYSESLDCLRDASIDPASASAYGRAISGSKGPVHRMRGEVENPVDRIVELLEAGEGTLSELEGEDCLRLGPQQSTDSCGLDSSTSDGLASNSSEITGS